MSSRHARRLPGFQGVDDSGALTCVFSNKCIQWALSIPGVIEVHLHATGRGHTSQAGSPRDNIEPKYYFQYSRHAHWAPSTHRTPVVSGEPDVLACLVIKARGGTTSEQGRQMEENNITIDIIPPLQKRTFQFPQHRSPNVLPSPNMRSQPTTSDSLGVPGLRLRKVDDVPDSIEVLVTYD